MDGNQPVLHIGSGSHFLRASHENPDLAASHFCEQFFLFCFRICRMDKGYFLLRHTCRNQFGADIVIDIERAVILRRGEITEQKLCQPRLFTLLPDPQYIGDTGVDLTSGIIRKKRIHQSLIQPQLPAVRGDFKHIVHGGIYDTAVDCRSPFRQLRHHRLLVLRGLNHHCFKF